MMPNKLDVSTAFTRFDSVIAQNEQAFEFRKLCGKDNRSRADYQREVSLAYMEHAPPVPPFKVEPGVVRNIGKIRKYICIKILCI